MHNAVLSMCDCIELRKKLTFLLLGVGLHLIRLILILCSDVSLRKGASKSAFWRINGGKSWRLERTGEVTTIEGKLLVEGQLNHVGTDFVHKVLRVGSDDEDVVVGGEVGFKPYDGFQIQVCRTMRSSVSPRRVPREPKGASHLDRIATSVLHTG